MRPPRKHKIPPLVIYIREVIPNPVPGLAPLPDDQLWQGKILTVTFGWHRPSRRTTHTAIGKTWRTVPEVRALIGPGQWAKFLHGKRQFVTYDQALRDWAWLAGVM